MCFGALAFAAAADEPEPQPAVRLDWVAPEECPSEQDVLAMTARDGGAASRAVHAVAHVRSTPNGYRLRLTVTKDGDAHVRELDAGSCQAVAEAAALLVAVAAESAPTEPSTVEPEDPSEPAGLVPQPVSVATQPGPAERPPRSRNARTDTPVRVEEPGKEFPSAPARKRRVSALVRAEGVVQLLRLLPRTAAGVALSAGVRGRRWRAEARGRYFFARPVDYPEPIAGGADISLWTGGVSGCYEPRFGRWSLPMCGGAAIGQMHAAGRDVALPQNASYPFAEVTAGAGATVTLSRRIAVTVGVEGAIPVIRPRFHIDDRPQLFRAGAGATRVLAGIEARLP